MRENGPSAAFSLLPSTTSLLNLPEILQQGNGSNRDLGMSNITDGRGHLSGLHAQQNIDSNIAYQQGMSWIDKRKLWELQQAQQQQVQHQQYLQHQQVQQQEYLQRQQQHQPTQERGEFHRISIIPGETSADLSFHSDEFKTLEGKERAQRIIHIQEQKKFSEEQKRFQQQQLESFQLEQEEKRKKEEYSKASDYVEVNLEGAQKQETKPIPVINWKENVPQHRGSVIMKILNHFSSANLPKILINSRVQEIELKYLISSATLHEYLDKSRLTEYLARCEL